MGNFIADAIAGRDIVIRGDGSPIRSYIDVADLTAWLLHILVFGKAGQAYNVGSEEGYSLADIARIVAEVLNPSLEIKVLGQAIPQQLASVYVPSTRKVRESLGVSHSFSLKESIRRTALAATRG